VLTISVPWAEPGSSFTALFEALVIDWLKEASVSAVADRMRLSWNAVDGIMQRAVKRGLARRPAVTPTRLGVDETSFQKRHEYVTVVTDHGDGGRVLHVADDRKTDSLKDYLTTLDDEQRAAIECISMDMWPAYIKAVHQTIPHGESCIAFDKFHVAKYLGDAVDKVRRQEHRALLAQGDTVLKGSKYRWLKNPNNMDPRQWREFAVLRESSLKTARAWAIKEHAMGLWGYTTRGWAFNGWSRWLGWAVRSRLPPIRQVAKTIKDHLWGIINAIVLKANNGRSEAINRRIQQIKSRACGFRNRERFRNAIYFHLGGLDLYPAAMSQS
jgi:transposase